MFYVTFISLAFLRGLVVTWHFYVTGLKQKQSFKIMGRFNFKCLS